MKNLLTQYAAYNLWANELMLDYIKSLPGDLHYKEVFSSFSHLSATVQHMWDAESIWWQRMKLMEPVRPPGTDFNGSFTDLATALLQQSRQWHSWVLGAQEHFFDHEFIYYNTRKEKFKQPIYQVLLHVFNHGTYHRGQLVTLLRQLQIDNIPQTDFIVWSRKRS